MKQIYIYHLKDENGNIRYVGKTTDVTRRLSGHISEARKNKGKRHVLNWIISLIIRDIKPIIGIIEICNENNWQEREKFWISYYRQLGLNLCNISEGGLGGSGVRNYSKEELSLRSKRMSLLMSKFTEDTKIHILNLILSGKSFIEIKNIYPLYSHQMHSGIRNGKQWNAITKLEKRKIIKKKGYTCSNKGLFIVRRLVNNKVKTIFSSRIEQDVIDYLYQFSIINGKIIW